MRKYKTEPQPVFSPAAIDYLLGRFTNWRESVNIAFAIAKDSRQREDLTKALRDQDAFELASMRLLRRLQSQTTPQNEFVSEEDRKRIKDFLDNDHKLTFSYKKRPKPKDTSNVTD